MRSDGARWTVPAIASATVPRDLLLVSGLLGGTYVLVAFGVGGLVRTVASAILLWWAPGYVTLAVLFPRASVGDDRTDDRRFPRWIRGVLSIGVSLPIQVLLGLALGRVGALATPGFSTAAVLNATALYIVVVGAVAARRRLSAPEHERLSVPFDDWLEAVSAGSRTDRLLAVGLAVSVLLCAGAFAGAVGAGPPEQSYTDFHVLTSNENGTYVAGGYPDRLVEGQPATLAWEVRNEESTRTNYTVVVSLERVAQRDGEQRVIERVEQNRTSVTVDAGESVIRNHTVRPTLVGDNLRLRYYLYRGDAPERANATTAYRHLQIPIAVAPSA